MKIVLFDGTCNVCNKSVQFIIKRDPQAKFRFASQQSEIGQELLRHYDVSPHMDSIVFIDETKAYTQSTAALRICKYLSSFWKTCYVGIIIPSFIRNIFYRLIANNRHKLMGNNESCILPTPDLQKRFL